MKSHIAFLCLVVAVVSAKFSYDGYKVLEVTPEDALQLEKLARLQNNPEYDFWLPPSGVDKAAHVMIPPGETAQFEKFLLTNGIRSRVKVENVQRSVEADELNRAPNGSLMDWNSFHNLSEIYYWLESLPCKYDFVERVSGGMSYENRQILGIEITFGTDFPGIVITSGLHGREWLAPAGTSWLVNRILNSRENSVFRRFNYLYFPVVNPDGYEYAWKEDRYWKKTRKPYRYGERGVSYGADPNRNFNCHWKAMNYPPSEIYPGPEPLSEVEIASLTEYLRSAGRSRKNLICLSYFTYGNKLMYPWAWTQEPSPRGKYWERIALSSAAAWHKVNGSDVTVGTVAETEYVAGGTSVDWFYARLNCTIPFVFEMRGDDFVVPPSEIPIAGRESLVSLKQILLEYKASSGTLG